MANTVVSLFPKCLESLAAALRVPSLEVRTIEYQSRQVVFERDHGDPVVGSLSAPRSLVASCWPTLETRLFAVQGDGFAIGDWDLLRRTLTCDLEGESTRVHTDWLALAHAVLEDGDREEAQLVWLQCSDFGLVSRRSAAFKAMFPEQPASAKLTSASSCAAFVERTLALASSPLGIDRFVVARALLDNLVEALHEVSGKRRERLMHGVVAALEQFENDDVPAVRELSRLLRAQWTILSAG